MRTDAHMLRCPHAQMPTDSDAHRLQCTQTQMPTDSIGHLVGVCSRSRPSRVSGFQYATAPYNTPTHVFRNHRFTSTGNPSNIHISSMEAAQNIDDVMLEVVANDQNGSAPSDGKMQRISAANHAFINTNGMNLNNSTSSSSRGGGRRGGRGRGNGRGKQFGQFNRQFTQVQTV
ncbi:hypothetical protein Ddc_21846 [Ditylenchus destructor]|nr:hypothetical protein Ddc_21846 [Ditylenchus destructor]